MRNENLLYIKHLKYGGYEAFIESDDLSFDLLQRLH